ncbi:hypothetical protein OKW38_002123 [Paraburkholderia sp. MM5496-R1]|uniref:hypothetical protein n=1 Tax=Paraburkholderia TaxID=1822464 RepID=UPI001160033D|nr:hypothetical protein [Paraburkholderia tuberum]
MTLPRVNPKNSKGAWHLSIFIRSVAHTAGGRFALSAGLPAAQQKMRVKAGERAVSDGSAVAFANNDPVRIHAK